MTAERRVEFKINVLGEAQLARALQGRIRACSDLSPAFGRIADDFFETQGRQFDAEGGFEGNPAWTPLNRAYAERKARTHPGAKILTRTGRLRSALTGGPGSIREIQPLRMTMGGSILVGRWDLGSLHQTGTKKMPARKPINLTMRQRHRWMRMITEHFRQEGRE